MLIDESQARCHMCITPMQAFKKSCGGHDAMWPPRYQSFTIGKIGIWDAESSVLAAVHFCVLCLKRRAWISMESSRCVCVHLRAHSESESEEARGANSKRVEAKQFGI